MICDMVRINRREYVHTYTHTHVCEYEYETLCEYRGMGVCGLYYQLCRTRVL